MKDKIHSKILSIAEEMSTRSSEFATESMKHDNPEVYWQGVLNAYSQKQ